MSVPDTLQKIAVVRRGLYDHASLPGWVRACGFDAVDIHRRQDITVDFVSSELMLCRLRDVPLDSFAGVIFVGMPWEGPKTGESPRNHSYRSVEWQAAFTAALWALPEGVVLNPGSVFAFNRNLGSSEFLRYKLADAGWKISPRHYLSSAPEPSAVSSLGSENERAVLLVGPRAGFVFMDDAVRKIPESIDKLTMRTEDMLKEMGLDFAAIAIELHNGEGVAFGMRPGIPAGACAPSALHLLSARLSPQKSTTFHPEDCLQCSS